MRSGTPIIFYPQNTTEQVAIPTGSLALLSGETITKVKLSDGTFIPLGGITDITDFGRDLIDLPNITELKILLGTATAWQPTSLTRRVDIDFTSASLGAISSIANAGSLGGDFGQTTSSKQPTGVDFLTYRAASFDGDDSLSGSTAWLVGANYAFFIAFSYDPDPPEQQYLYSGHPITVRAAHSVGSRNTTGNLVGPAHKSSDTWYAGNGSTANYGNIDFVYCSYDGSNFHTKFNGSIDSIVANTAVPDTGYNTVGAIGAANIGSEYAYNLKGKIFRVIGFSSHQSDTDIAKMEGWAAWNFGRTSMLPANHPYKNVRPIV